MPDWFLNANGQVISEDTKRQEPMKSIMKEYKSGDGQFWNQILFRIVVAHPAFAPVNSVYQ